MIHFPGFYINTASTDDLIESGVEKVYRIKIKKTGLFRNYRKKLSVINITGTAGGEEIEIAIFNQPYLAETIKNLSEIKVHGKVISGNGRNRMENPRIIKGKEGIIPVYGNIGGISGGVVRNIVDNIFRMKEGADDVLPPHLVKKYGFPEFWSSLEEIHSPSSEHVDTEELKRRFIYSEFLYFQIEIAYIRSKSGKTPRKRHFRDLPPPQEILEKYVGFTLTPDQRKAFTDIISDLDGGTTMQRLLLGDVGSGKTIISFLFLLLAVLKGFQGAFLAPTEVLIRQHYDNAAGFFAGFRIAVLTGSTPHSERNRIIKGLRDGGINVVFGTHALINEKIEFRELSAIVIDEQHRFGVAQRASLFYKGVAADLLVTTATPIPRTLRLSLYRDLDVSEIRSMPEGRIPVRTLIIKRHLREEFYSQLRSRVQNGEKIFIVLPLISRSAKFSRLRSLESEQLFFREIFRDIPFRIISGKHSQEDRDDALKNFAGGDTKILISTTIIEVGIDIRDATIIVIEDADKFGLSQLHQLRGRVGRGNRQSYCYLFPSPSITLSGRERLNIIRGTDNGFEIAEKDLGMRGGGNITGREQSGFLDFRIAGMTDYPDLYLSSGKDAVELIEDPSLWNSHITEKLNIVSGKMSKISFS